MDKSNYFAAIHDSRDKKVAERRVYCQQLSREAQEILGVSKQEFVYFRNALWNVEDLLKEGYRLFYRFVPSHGCFPIIDVALSVPVERKPGQLIGW